MNKLFALSMNVVASYRLLIPAVKTFRLLVCLVALLVCSPLIQAQTDTDSVASAIEEYPEETTDQAETKTVTTLPPPPEFRTVPDSVVRRLKSDKDFEYANDPEYWDLAGERERKRKREQEEREQALRSEREQYKSKKTFWDYFNSTFSGFTIRIVTYILLSMFFLFVIYRIMVVNKLFLFYHPQKAKAKEAAGVADIEDDNLDEKIRKATQTGDHRQAVRFMYLKTLHLLNERQWIKYHADATNYEYVIQMSKHKLGNDFSSLTRIYDYVWYGEFALTPEQFEIVHNNFSHFYNAANS